MTEMGEIPEYWEVELMENIAQRQSGHTPDKKVDKYWNGDIPWISLKDTKYLDNGYIKETTDYTTEEGIKNSSAVILPKGTVILSRDATVGKVGITVKEMATSQHFINYICGEKLHNLYLYYDFLNRKSLFEGIAIGSTIKTIGLPFFKSLKIVLPPIKEQQKIALILSNIDDQIENTDNLIEKTKELKKGLMRSLLTKGIGHDRFKNTEVGMIPEEWEIKTLEECFIFQNGKAFYTEGYSNKGKKVIDLMNISTEGIFQELKNKQKYISNELYNKFQEYQLNKDDLIMAMSDMSSKLWIIGRTAIVPADKEYVLNQRIGRLICKSNVYVKFANYITNSDYFLSQIRKNAKGTAQFYVNTGDITSSVIALPSLEEQKWIASILSSVDEKICQYKLQKVKLIELKKGLMQKLLLGIIRVK